LVSTTLVILAGLGIVAGVVVWAGADMAVAQVKGVSDLEDAPAGAAEHGSAGAKNTKPAKRGMFPAALEVPKLREEFETLFRDRKFSEALLVFSMERLEAARASEARNVSTFQVLDPPTLPTRRSRPKRAQVVLLFTLVGLVLAFGAEWWRQNGGRLPFGVKVPGKTNDGSVPGVRTAIDQ
jgi:hypothetical protein